MCIVYSPSLSIVSSCQHLSVIIDSTNSVGPYCQYMETPAARTALNDCGSFQEYLAGLSRESCATMSIDDINREPGFTWTPDDTTPNTVYYQVRNCNYLI